MLATSSVNAAQIYGGLGSANLGLLSEESQTDLASGGPNENGNKSTVMYYVAFLVLLIVIRLLYEYAK